MRTMLLTALSLCMAAGCSSSNGNTDGSLDVLPKRGERTTDPTIVSATAGCSGELMFKGLVVQVDASDPAPSNLGSCAAMFGAIMGQGQFAGTGRCVVEVGPDCTVGTDYVVDLTIGNKTGGVTVATVKLRAGP
jgi:hypothetical protein